MTLNEAVAKKLQKGITWTKFDRESHTEKQFRIVSSLCDCGLEFSQLLRDRFLGVYPLNRSTGNLFEGDFYGMNDYLKEWQEIADSDPYGDTKTELLFRLQDEHNFSAIYAELSDGFSPDEIEVIIYSKAFEVGEAEIEIVKNIFEGNLYHLMLEEFVTYIAPKGKIERWEDVGEWDYPVTENELPYLLIDRYSKELAEAGYNLEKFSGEESRKVSPSSYVTLYPLSSLVTTPPENGSIPRPRMTVTAYRMCVRTDTGIGRQYTHSDYERLTPAEAILQLVAIGGNW